MTPARIRMTWRAALLVCLPGLAGLSAPARPHVGDRVYPIAYLSDEMLEDIRLDDGFADEWSELVGEPTLTILDFSETFSRRQYDPSDLDFRIWLAWHDDPARIYAAFVSSDDVYINEHDYSVESSFRDVIWTHDSISLAVDGDHRGGPALSSNATLEDREEHLGSTQSYDAIARTASGPILDVGIIRVNTGTFAWTTLPPYGEGGGGVFGEAPIISVIELYVTPFDDWEGWDSPGEIEVSKLSAGRVIGFAMIVYDYDYFETFSRDSDPWARWTAGSDYRQVWRLRGDRFLDGLLLGPDPSAPPDDSAVESVSWARIKASLEVE